MPLVLTADDSAAIQRVVQVSLYPYAIDVISADNLTAALDKTAAQQVDLIIADAELRGTTALPDLQRLTTDGKIPLILLLSSYSRVDKATLTELGFQQILPKPFDSRELLQLVAFNLQMDLDEGCNADWQPFPVRAAKENAPPTTPSPPVLPGVAEDAAHGDGVDHNFATLVKKAVFEYCQNNFPRIAREMVLAEIRRLQKEKSDPMSSN